jgi:hypothetical protein
MMSIKHLITSLIFIYYSAIARTNDHVATAFLITAVQQRQQQSINWHHECSSLPMDDPRVEPRVTYKIESLPLPLGITLEDMDMLDSSYGVAVVGMSQGGNAGEKTCNISTSLSAPSL